MPLKMPPELRSARLRVSLGAAAVVLDVGEDDETGGLGAVWLGAAEGDATGAGDAGVASTARFCAGAGASAASSIQPPAPLFTSWMRR